MPCLKCVPSATEAGRHTAFPLNKPRGREWEREGRDARHVRGCGGPGGAPEVPSPPLPLRARKMHFAIRKLDFVGRGAWVRASAFVA
jgi:hypothetical protein